VIFSSTEHGCEFERRVGNGEWFGKPQGIIWGQGNRAPSFLVTSCGIVEEWVDIHQQEGLPLPESLTSKSFSGKFVIRVGKDLHKALAIKAATSGKSLKNLCTNLLQNSVAQQD